MRTLQQIGFELRIKSIFLSILSFLFTYLNILVAQPERNLRWVQTSSPIYSDIDNLFLFSNRTGVASGKKILFLENSTWHKMQHQPPADVNLLYANNSNSIFIASDTEFQETELFYWDGKNWDEFYHPLANTIISMQFSDKHNGVIGGLGEIAIIKDDKWQFLPPPTSKSISALQIENNKTIWALSPGEGLFKFNKVWKRIKHSENVYLIKLFENILYVVSRNFLGIIDTDSIKIISFNKKLNQVSSFFVIDENNFLMVGTNGMILKYSNNQWVEIESGINSDLRSISMLNSSVGWITGNDGILLHYTNEQNINSFSNHWKGFEKKTFYSNSKFVDDEYGVVTADFNNDGLEDIFTCGLYEKNHLYMNKGNFRFSDEGDERGVSGQNKNGETTRGLNLGACTGDFDNDGKIDIYVTSLTTQNKIYHNLSNGNFVDYSNIAKGVGESSDRSNAVITGDVDNDGDLDLFICNENTTNRLYQNNGAGIFTEVTESINLTSEFGGTGASFADIDSDGDLDLFVTNWSDKNKLYKNLFSESGKLKFIDFTDSANVGGDIFTKSNGVVFADIDNDADMDLFVTNRKTSNRFYTNNGKGFFKDETKKYFGKDSLRSYGAVIADFDNDGYKDLYLANVGVNKFYKNINGFNFKDQTDLFEADVKGYSTGIAVADLDNDNNIDLYVANYIGSSSTILKNKSNSTNSATIKLVGSINNSSAIGTKVYAYKSGFLGKKSHLLFYSEVSGGSGYASMNGLKQIIPFAKAKRIDVKVVFPLGEEVTQIYITPGSSITIGDIKGSNKRFINTKKFISRFLFDPHRLFEFVKWIFIITLLLFSSYFGKRNYAWSLKVILTSTFLLILSYLLFQTIFEYDNFFFSTILPITSVVTAIAILHLSYERKRLKQKTEIEKQKLQAKFSRDLHDDLAGTLGSVTIYLELLKQALKNNSKDIWTFFNKSETLLVGAKQTITDLIWTVKPKPERVTDFVTKIRENFIPLFKEKNIHFKVSEINLLEYKFLSSNEKHNIYLIIKESLNNIIKHANATEVLVTVEQKRKTLIFDIIDNGKGFDIETFRNRGNGINNIQRRSKEINAKFSIESNLEEGTKIKINLK